MKRKAAKPKNQRTRSKANPAQPQFRMGEKPQRNHKDSTFCLLFSEPRRAVELYNAVSGENLPPSGDVRMPEHHQLEYPHALSGLCQPHLGESCGQRRPLRKEPGQVSGSRILSLLCRKRAMETQDASPVGKFFSRTERKFIGAGCQSDQLKL